MTPTQKILVVDDDDAIRTLVTSMLQVHGYEVLSANGGEAALAILNDPAKGNDIIAIYLDILMPGMNGMDVLAIIKTQPHTKHLPVLMLTTKDLAEDIIEGYQYGADYYIPKPFTTEQLIYGLRLVTSQEECVEAEVKVIS